MQDENEEELTEKALPIWERLSRIFSFPTWVILCLLDSGGGYFDKSVRSSDDQETQRMKIRLYFYYYFYRRFVVWGTLGSLMLSLSLIGDLFVAGVSLPLQAYGLLFDAFGALILAVGLFRGPNEIKRDTPRESTGAVAGGDVYYNSVPLSATVQDTVDGVFGGTLLVFGFSIQFISVVDITPTAFFC